MIPIKGYTTFHPLKHCIVGRPTPPEYANEDLKEIMRRTEADFDYLVKTLESFGVQCYRPNVEDVTVRPPLSPRDYFIVIGEKLFVGKVISGYKDILKEIDRNNIEWYLGNDISSGNMVRCGNHIHWDVNKQVSKEAEIKMTKSLESHGYKIYKTRHGWHMDGVYSILQPGVIVATHDLPELEEIYPRWDICYVDKSELENPIKHTWGGDHEESNYDINILSIDEANCVVTAVNKKLFNFLEKNKINPVVCKFRDRAFWDNGIHCVTQDLYREGTLENYFR
jgi:hypothetical protein